MVIGSNLVKLVVFTAVFRTFECQNSCPPEWITVGRKCFYHLEERGTLEDNYNLCKRKKANLASIDSQEENESLVRIISGTVDKSVWLGLIHFVNFEWKWTNNKEIKFDNRKSNKLLCTSDCCGYVLNSNQKWYDVNCDAKYSQLCQLDLDEESVETDAAVPKVDISGNYTERESQLCPHGWQEFNRKCFYNYDDADNLVKSKDTCSGIHDNATLVTIHSKEENDFIKSLISNDNSKAWIGAIHDQINYGSYIWIDDSRFNYINWVNNPSGCIFSCCAVSVNTDGQWDSEPCKNKNTILCQIDFNKSKDNGQDNDETDDQLLKIVVAVVLLIIISATISVFAWYCFKGSKKKIASV